MPSLCSACCYVMCCVLCNCGIMVKMRRITGIGHMTLGEGELIGPCSSAAYAAVSALSPRWRDDHEGGREHLVGNHQCVQAREHATHQFRASSSLISAVRHPTQIRRGPHTSESRVLPVVILEGSVPLGSHIFKMPLMQISCAIFASCS